VPWGDSLLHLPQIRHHLDGHSWALVFYILSIKPQLIFSSISILGCQCSSEHTHLFSSSHDKSWGNSFQGFCLASMDSSVTTSLVFFVGLLGARLPSGSTIFQFVFTFIFFMLMLPFYVFFLRV
jgi:hypothetical protein